MRNAAVTGILSLIVAWAVAACAPGTPAAPSGQDGGVGPQTSAAPRPMLVIVLRGEPPSLAAKPVVPFSGALDPPTTLFNATLDYVDHQGERHPYLVEALPQVNTDTWRVFPDGRMETAYRLKSGLTWHDGRPLSSEDFVFGWRVYSTPELGLATSPPIGQMEGVVAPDARTVVIRWRQLYADAGILERGFQALPRHILEGPLQELDPVAFSNHPFWSTEYMGLGPYRLQQWEPGAFIEGGAFEAYVLGRPKIDRVRLLFIGDPNTAIANVLAGEAHFVGDFVLSETDGSTLEREWAARGEAGSVLYAPTQLRLSVVQLRPEHADPPALLDVRVRRALAHAIDAVTAAEVLTDGRAVVTSTLSSPRVPYYPEIERAITRYPYDPRRAQQLLEEAGFTRGPDGFFGGRDGGALRLGVWSSSGTKNEQENAVFVDSLRRSGVDASRQVVPVALVRDAQARALIPGLSTRGHAQRRLEAYTSEQIPRPDNRWKGDNRGGWASPEYDRLFQAYATTLGRSERIQVIAQMEKVFTAELPGIPHFFGLNVTAHAGALVGPVARQTPEAGLGYLHVHQWEWRS